MFTLLTISRELLCMPLHSWTERYDSVVINMYDDIPLHQAAECAVHATNAVCISSIPLLLAFGADVNAADAQCHTALHRTAMSARAQVLEYLICSGADIHSAG